jgi:hypothetical protein
MCLQASQLLYIDQEKIEREKPLGSGVASHRTSFIQRLNLMRPIKLYSGWLFKRASSSLVAVLLLVLLLGSRSVLANSEVVPAQPSTPSIVPEDSVSDIPMAEQSVQLDPINSPYPVPWNWVLATLAEVSRSNTSTLRYYRSQSLISPDGQYAAYSRIQMRVSPEFTQSRVSSVLFLENLRTGDLQTITASSPLADNPFTGNMFTPMEVEAGAIAILIPVAWSETGDRILAREFESLFGSDIASDYAVVWDRHQNRTYTIAPTRVQYSNAVLLGWSQTHPGQVLFQAGNLGDTQNMLWAVDFSGQTVAAIEDQPVIFGRVVNNIWAGPQAHR